jgi:hypothetical protein
MQYRFGGNFFVFIKQGANLNHALQTKILPKFTADSMN